MLILVIATSAVGFVVTPMAGALSDKFGRQRIYLLGLALISVVAFPLYWALDAGMYGFIAVGYVAATVAVYTPWALQPAYFSDAFDARVRYSGLSTATTLGNLFGSAIAPSSLEHYSAQRTPHSPLRCMFSSPEPYRSRAPLCSGGRIGGKRRRAVSGTNRPGLTVSLLQPFQSDVRLRVPVSMQSHRVEGWS